MLCTGHAKNEIRQLLLSSMNSPSEGVRYCAVQWALRIFETSDFSARYVCIPGKRRPQTGSQGSGFERPECRERSLQYRSFLIPVHAPLTTTIAVMPITWHSHRSRDGQATSSERREQSIAKPASRPPSVLISGGSNLKALL